MTAMPEEQHQTPRVPEKEDPLRYVETLADEHDYWMSLTDAARVTRTSEAMARRWVSSGRLPVKREPAGINQRTRLVRASDVARIRPIVDPTAAITDDIHKLDLLSIPRQHMQLEQEHGRLREMVQSVQQIVQRLAEETREAFEQAAAQAYQQEQVWDQRLQAQRQALQQAVDIQSQHHEGLARLVSDQAQDMERVQHEFHALDTQQQSHVEQVRTTLLAHLQEAQEALWRQVERLDQDRQRQEDHVQQMVTVLRLRQDELFAQALLSSEEARAHAEQERQQMQEKLQALEAASSTQQAMLTTFLAQQIPEIHAALAQHAADVAQENRTLNERVERLEQQLSHLARQAEGTERHAQERIESQNRQIQSLTVLLQEESRAREQLSAQMATLRQPREES